MDNNLNRARECSFRKDFVIRRFNIVELDAQQKNLTVFPLEHSGQIL